jgi:prepilin-type N-terminal cleavage/methylation domain-containing protein
MDDTMTAKKAFSLVELIFVIAIVSILAAVLIPIIMGKIDSAKWAEANTVAGAVKTAVLVHFADTKERITGPLDDEDTQKKLGLTEADLTTTYFVPQDYNIDSVDDDGSVQVTVTGSQPNAPKGSKTLKSDGTWQ